MLVSGDVERQCVTSTNNSSVETVFTSIAEKDKEKEPYVSRVLKAEQVKEMDAVEKADIKDLHGRKDCYRLLQEQSRLLEAGRTIDAYR